MIVEVADLFHDPLLVSGLAVDFVPPRDRDTRQKARPRDTTAILPHSVNEVPASVLNLVRLRLFPSVFPNRYSRILVREQFALREIFLQDFDKAHLSCLQES